MKPPRGILENSYDPVDIVYPDGFSSDSAREIEREEPAPGKKEAMLPAGSVEVESYDLVTIVNPQGEGKGSTGHIDRGEATSGEQEAMDPSSRVPEASHNLAEIIDPGGAGSGRAAKVAVARSKTASSGSRRNVNTTFRGQVFI